MNVSIIKGTNVAYDPAQIDLNGEIGSIYGKRDKGEESAKVQTAIKELVSAAASTEKNPVEVDGQNYEQMTPVELASMKRVLEQADGGAKGTYTLAEFKKAQALLGKPMAEVDPFAETEAATQVEAAPASGESVVAQITDAAQGITGGYWYGFNGADNTTQIVAGKKAIVKSIKGNDPGFGVVIGKPTKGATHLQVTLSGKDVRPGYNKVVLQVFSSPSEERSQRVEFGFYPGGATESGQWAPDNFATSEEAESFFGNNKTTILIPLGDIKNINKLQVMAPGSSSGTILIYSVALVKK